MDNYRSTTFQNHKVTEPWPAPPSADSHCLLSTHWVLSLGAAVAQEHGDGRHRFVAQAFICKRRVLGSGPGLLRMSCGNPLNKKIMTVENLLVLGKPKPDHDQVQCDFLKPPQSTGYRDHQHRGKNIQMRAKNLSQKTGTRRGK